MRLAYADPPYIGQAERHYGKHADFGGEVNHVELIWALREKYDGWALSCHVNSLRTLLPLCPETVRIGAWIKPFAFFKGGVSPKYAWEPVIFVSARSAHERKVLGLHGPQDWVSCNVWGTTKAEREQSTVKGQKPFQVCVWLFHLLGADPSQDTFDDLFVGSGAVTEAWEEFKRAQGRVADCVSARS